MHIKTAVSIDKDLFDKAEQIAKELGVSRSRLFSMGIQEVISKQENRKLLRQMNRALEKIYPDTDDEEHLRRVKGYHRRMFSSD